MRRRLRIALALGGWLVLAGCVAAAYQPSPIPPDQSEPANGGSGGGDGGGGGGAM